LRRQLPPFWQTVPPALIACTTNLGSSTIPAFLHLAEQPNRHCACPQRTSTVSLSRGGIPDPIVARGNSVRSSVSDPMGLANCTARRLPPRAKRKWASWRVSAEQLSALTSLANARGASHQAAIAFARRNHCTNQCRLSFIQSLCTFGVGPRDGSNSSGNALKADGWLSGRGREINCDCVCACEFDKGGAPAVERDMHNPNRQESTALRPPRHARFLLRPLGSS